MAEIPDAIHARLRQHGEERILAEWQHLHAGDRALLLELLEVLDPAILRPCYERGVKKGGVPPREQIRRAQTFAADERAAEARAAGESALRQSQVAALVVAGGKGTRLGFDRPKGMYPVGPVSQRSFFQIFAEQILARRRKHECRLPFLVLTSRATDAETRAFFAANQNFGLDYLHFFVQGELPVFEIATGRPLRHHTGELVTSPNGHGGTLAALHDSGLLTKLAGNGVEHLCYFQVDNPLVKIADPVFLGQHILMRSEASTKVVPKASPLEAMGNIIEVNGRCSVVEYSDLDREQAHWTDEEGRHLFVAGSTAMHIFDVAFLRRLAEGHFRMPLHLARKKAAARHPHGEHVPEQENAVQFERFIFDVLPQAERYLVVETSPAEEFAPLKNRTGTDTPETVRQALTNRARDWLRRAGMTVPDGLAVEISPLAALEPDDLIRNREAGIRVERIS
ncbi:MAG: UTP--glucose-1-phosphate uridylyltransferase [Gemmataceae bacterium]